MVQQLREERTRVESELAKLNRAILVLENTLIPSFYRFALYRETGKSKKLEKSRLVRAFVCAPVVITSDDISVSAIWKI